VYRRFRNQIALANFEECYGREVRSTNRIAVSMTGWEGTAGIGGYLP
jgi:hypothetical protein